MAVSNPTGRNSLIELVGALCVSKLECLLASLPLYQQFLIFLVSLLSALSTLDPTQQNNRVPTFISMPCLTIRPA